MALIGIDNVTSLSDTSHHIAGASIEVPHADSERDLWWIPISGWVVGRNERVTSIEVVQQHTAIKSAPVDIERTDVAWAHPGLPGADRAGFSLRVGAVWLPENFVLRLEAGFENGHRVPIALIRGHHAAIEVVQNAGIQPISVTALPRSGSTLVMQMLSELPSVVVHGGHPYSARPAAYWTHMLRVLADPADVRHSAHPDTFQEHLRWVGSHPFNDAAATDSTQLEGWFGRDYVDRLAEFSKRSATEFYLQVAQAQGVEKPVYFAEKSEPGATARLTASLFPNGRELLLVRDFRDMACSMRAFARRTAPAHSEAVSDEQFVSSLIPAVARLVAYSHERDEVQVVRYEDLVADPHTTLRGIASYLELDAGDDLLAAIVARATGESPELLRHRTSDDAASSVGRYREEMGPDLLATAEDAFGPALDTFGYERSVRKDMVSAA